MGCDMAQDITSLITQALREFTTDVMDEIDRQAIKIANTTVKELKRTSPRRFHGGRHYADGWGRRKVDGAQVVYNKTKPGLTHLLEHGHMMRNGGRTRAFPHILPAEEKAIKEYEKAVEQAIESGGEPR